MRKHKHSPEFREQAVKQTLTGDESIKDRAARLSRRRAPKFAQKSIAEDKRQRRICRARIGCEQRGGRMSAASIVWPVISGPVSGAMRHDARRRSRIALGERSVFSAAGSTDE